MKRKTLFYVALAVSVIVAAAVPFSMFDAEAQTLPDINLASTYAWDAAPGAAAYNVEVLDAINVQINPPGVVQTTALSIGVDTFLFVGGVIAPNGTKKFRVQSVGPGGSPVSAWKQDNANFVGLGPPTNTRFE